jgi:hypothetical protein
LVILVPVVMLRPTPAGRAGCPDPLVQTGRTQAAGFERVPFGSAAVMEIFRIIAVPARP